MKSPSEVILTGASVCFVVAFLGFWYNTLELPKKKRRIQRLCFYHTTTNIRAKGQMALITNECDKCAREKL